MLQIYKEFINHAIAFRTPAKVLLILKLFLQILRVGGGEWDKYKSGVARNETNSKVPGGCTEKKSRGIKVMSRRYVSHAVRTTDESYWADRTLYLRWRATRTLRSAKGLSPRNVVCCFSWSNGISNKSLAMVNNLTGINLLARSYFHVNQRALPIAILDNLRLPILYD